MAASTSKEDDVTPPLLAEASLNKITPASSKIYLAPSVMNKLAPSTMYLNLGVPLLRNIFSTLTTLIASGLPPQGTKKSATNSSLK